ncbi:MAG: VanW family protein, partial [Chloroflexi bacterium]|nr:VanW family protein [Chloroflexota bacterium]
WTLSKAQLASMLIFSRGETDGQQRVVAELDREDLATFVENIASKVNRNPRDARFRYASGKLSVSTEAIDGVTVNVEKTVEAINTLATTHYRQAGLDVTTEKAKIQGSDAASIVVGDLLSSASTSYAGSVRERAHNVELATARLNGVVVPPGEVFSMNDSLGPTTLASGFQVAYGISISGTVPITVKADAGGICQVATTLYHTAFWAGLKIEERQPHLYWISRYGQPPKGMTGLDATVDDPGPDLKIRNNTGNWIAIQSYASGAQVHFSIYGVDPGWKVTAEGPRISNRVPADTAMVEQEDPTMSQGSSLLVEHAEDGFDSSIVRHVLDKDGQEIERYVVNSHYLPSHNVLLVPVKPKEPTPAPTPATTGTPAPSGTPEPTGTPTPAGTPAPTGTPTPGGNR